MNLIALVWRAALAAAPLRIWALFLGAVPLTAGAVSLVLIIWRGGWPAYLARVQLDILGWALMATYGLIGMIVVALAAIKVSGRGPGGLGFEIDGDGPDAPHPPRREDA